MPEAVIVATARSPIGRDAEGPRDAIAGGHPPTGIAPELDPPDEGDQQATGRPAAGGDRQQPTVAQPRPAVGLFRHPQRRGARPTSSARSRRDIFAVRSSLGRRTPNSSSSAEAISARESESRVTDSPRGPERAGISVPQAAHDQPRMDAGIGCDFAAKTLS